jgi:hypothetical protein
MYKVKSFIRKTWYRDTDDFKEQSNNQLKFCVPEEFRNQGSVSNLGEELKKKLDAFDTTLGAESSGTLAAANACVAKGCDVQAVGDWICDSKCNNQECHWDAGDCDLPADRLVNREVNLNKHKAFVFQSTFKPGENSYTVTATNVPDLCGDSECNEFVAYVCKLPYCDPNTYLNGNPDNFEGRPEEGGYYHTISEKDSCPNDCPVGTDATKNTKFDGQYVDIVSDTSGTGNLHTVNVIWKTSVEDKNKYIKNWDGSLPDKTKANSVKRRYGIRYQAPKGSALLSDSLGRTFFKFRCDGTFGFGLGNGFDFMMRMPAIYKLINLGSSLVKYTQSCRYEMQQIGDITLDVFRANWQLWNPMNGGLLRFTQGKDGKRPELKGVQKEPHRPYNIVPYPSQMRDIMGQGFTAPACDPRSGKQCTSGSDWRVTMPETCSYEVYQKYGVCRLKYVGLTELLGTKSELLFEMARCSKTSGMEESLFEMAMVMTGDVATTFSPIQWCKTDTECASSEKCVDVKNLVNLDSGLNTENTRRKGANAYHLDKQMLRDPFAAAVYGMKGGNEQCVEKKMPIQNSIRNLIRKMAYLSEDSETDINICMPSWVTNPNEIVKRGATFATNKLYFENNGLVVEGLEKTGKSALYYSLDKYSSGTDTGTPSTGTDTGTATPPLELQRDADEGYVFQKISMDINGGSKATTCMSEDKLKRSVVKYLKTLKNNDGELMFQKMSLSDVLITCDDSKRRRMLLASKVKLTISIQMPEANAAAVVKKVAEKMAEPEAKQALATNMQNEGVMLADETLISVESVESITAEKKTSKTAKASGSGEVGKAVQQYNNDPNIKETNKAMEDMGGDVKKEEEEDDDIKVEMSISRTTLIYIIVGAVVVCCLCAIAIGAGLYFMGKSNSNSNAPRQGKPQMTPNPTYEMRATPVVYTTNQPPVVYATNQKPNQMAF